MEQLFVFKDKIENLDINSLTRIVTIEYSTIYHEIYIDDSSSKKYFYDANMRKLFEVEINFDVTNDRKNDMVMCEFYYDKGYNFI